MRRCARLVIVMGAVVVFENIELDGGSLASTRVYLLLSGCCCLPSSDLALCTASRGRGKERERERSFKHVSQDICELSNGRL